MRNEENKKIYRMIYDMMQKDPSLKITHLLDRYKKKPSGYNFWLKKYILGAKEAVKKSNGKGPTVAVNYARDLDPVIEQIPAQQLAQAMANQDEMISISVDAAIKKMSPSWRDAFHALVIKLVLERKPT